ncbi:MAG TPA: hypothetical protein VGK24_00965 [Candidatus Angelobacter sp.]|jgi:hypothetical protein
MIEKFNFYDIYGYVLPGGVFLAILWAPFGLVKGTLPPGDWSAALIAGAIAYVMGHLLQNVATNAIPSRRTTKRNRYPSEICLDPVSELPTAAKVKIKTLIETQFGLNLQIDKEGDAEIDSVRNSAFLLARQVLIQGKAVSYAEQFQGMYALSRCLFSAFWVACAYWVGWAAAAARSTYLLSGAIILLVSAFLGLLNILIIRAKVTNPETKHRLEIAYALGLSIVFLTAGYLAGANSHLTSHISAILAFMAACSLLACYRLKGAYNYYAGRFASTVWRDYLAFNVTSAGSHEPSNQDV